MFKDKNGRCHKDNGAFTKCKPSAKRRPHRAGSAERRITTTYSIITEESAQEGNYAETGWIDEEGEVIEADLDNDETVVDAAVKWLQRHGANDASSSRFHPGIWYSLVEDADLRTGDVTEKHFHLRGFTDKEQRQIYAELFPRRR